MTLPADGAFLVSTPTIRGLSRIEREYEASDRRRFFVPCPHCGREQWLKFERLRWVAGQPETAAYHCEGCEAPIAEHHKTAMLAAAEWRATATAADPLTVGYHLSALYSPVGWLSWARIARAHEAARGSDEAMRAFRNTTAEQLVTVKTKRGFTKLEWQKLRERNEALDLRVYARAAAWIAGADRWAEARWADLEAQLGVVAGDKPGADAPAAGAAVTRVAPRRRTVRSSYMG